MFGFLFFFLFWFEHEYLYTHDVWVIDDDRQMFCGVLYAILCVSMINVCIDGYLDVCVCVCKWSNDSMLRSNDN